MSTKATNLDEVIELAKRLNPRDKVRLIELLAPLIESDLINAQSNIRNSLYGLCKDLGPAPSTEEIDEARRLEWKSA